MSDHEGHSNGSGGKSPSTKKSERSSPRKIHFAPLNIPLERRLQTLAVLFHTISIPYCLGLFFLVVAFPPFWPFVIAYLIWVFSFDKCAENGEIQTRRSPFLRRLPFGRLYCDYFPISIHREVELQPTFPNRLREPSGTLERWIGKLFGANTSVVEPANDSDNQTPSPAESTEKNGFEKEIGSDGELGFEIGPRYVFGYHPHGIVSLGAFGAIGTEGAGWETLFPGIPVSLLTLESNFRLPFYREYLLSLGISSVSRRSCDNLLKHNQSICIVVGGAGESLYAEPGRLDLILKKRRGFVRLAMQALPAPDAPPTCLVPILSFGENEVYEQVRGDQSSLLYKIQTMIKKVAGFTLPLLHARGVFNYDWGLMPYRRPITLVVGKPIAVPYVAHPTESEIAVYHGLYVKELQRLWDTYKSDYVKDYTGKGFDNIDLRLVE
ncbi:diacylglycerol acyltransferase-domain-containing protein [Kockiozyma suomiensis]|uniref:diacylglycerol acyltransferase-domain-containing protein n=1 Tax=Kockiozyma suomiensis TaxID=1337062 RepID=UPI00334316FB